MEKQYELDTDYMMGGQIFLYQLVLDMRTRVSSREGGGEERGQEGWKEERDARGNY